MSKSKEQLFKEFEEKVGAAKISFEDYVKDLMTDLSNELKKIDNEQKKRFEVELPEDNTEVYYIDDYDNTINFDNFQESSEDDETRFRNGMLFESAEEAEKFLKERRLLFKIKKWAEIHNNGWTPDWKVDSCEKYVIYYNNGSGTLKINTWMINDNMIKLPYFETRAIAQACIKEFGDEIIEVLIKK